MYSLAFKQVNVVYRPSSDFTFLCVSFTSERNHLELATAGLLNSLVSHGQCSSLALDHRFLQQLEAAIGTQGLSFLSTEKFKEAVINLILHILKSIPQITLRSMVCRPTLEALASHAISIIESDSSCEFIIPLLVHLTLVDVQPPAPSLLGGEQDDIGSNLLDSRKRKRGGMRVKKQEWLGVFSSLLGRLSDLSSEKNPVTNKELKYIYVILQVASKCLGYIGNKDQALRLQ
ncbi:hypothetical protein ElyMa_000731700 [Elysia marginata]|uniref:HEAT repeat-containing protein 1 n=1 Tax=Elysia marginata TaxID=1093978 RepID=A0AAV4GNE8_9GAST|nr:hypothetical protein ElyMa_000731700 [Elysia marginata]